MSLIDQNEPRCLGHAHDTPKSWCAMSNECARHVQIRHDGRNMPAPAPRLCVSQEFERFIAHRPRLDVGESEGGEI